MAKSTWMLIGFGVSIFSAYLLYKNQKEDLSAAYKHVWPAGRVFQSDIKSQEKEKTPETTVEDDKGGVGNITEQNVTKKDNGLKDETKNDAKDSGISSEETKQKQEKITIDRRNSPADSESPGPKSEQLHPPLNAETSTNKMDESASAKQSETASDTTKPSTEDIANSLDNEQDDQIEKPTNIHHDDNVQKADEDISDHEQDFPPNDYEPEDPYDDEYTDSEFETYNAEETFEDYDEDSEHDGDGYYEMDNMNGDGEYEENDQYDQNTEYYDENGYPRDDTGYDDENETFDYNDDDELAENFPDNYEYYDEKEEIETNDPSNGESHYDSANKQEDKAF